MKRRALEFEAIQRTTLRTIYELMRCLSPVFVFGLIVSGELDAAELSKNTPPTSNTVSTAANTRVLRPCDTPVGEQKVEANLCTSASTPLGAMSVGSVFWHLHVYPTRADAESARGTKGTVVDSFGKYWVFTIAEESWRPARGQRVAMVGPLVVEVGTPYTALYLEANFPHGIQQASRDMPGHRHPGPEAWYVLTGAQCLETPNGFIQASAGHAMMVPEGWPMAISSVGSETRRTVALILHRSADPFAMSIDDARSPGAPHSQWKPQGLCPHD